MHQACGWTLLMYVGRCVCCYIRKPGTARHGTPLPIGPCKERTASACTGFCMLWVSASFRLCGAQRPSPLSQVLSPTVPRTVRAFNLCLLFLLY